MTWGVHVEEFPLDSLLQSRDDGSSKKQNERSNLELQRQYILQSAGATNSRNATTYRVVFKNCRQRLWYRPMLRYFRVANAPEGSWYMSYNFSRDEISQREAGTVRDSTDNVY